MAGSTKRSPRRAASSFLPSASLAGRSARLSRDIPVFFDTSLAPHHKLIGRWVASHQPCARDYSRPQARWRIERAFHAAVLDILNPVDLSDLRVGVVQHAGEGPPALAIICCSMGQLDLGWIEDSDAPIPWRVAAYKLLERTLDRVLPVFGYEALFDHFSMYYWDGEADDDGARRCLMEYHGVPPDELDDCMLPSMMDARRPPWMIGENAGRGVCLPASLRAKLTRLRAAHRAIMRCPRLQNAWNFDTETVCDYIPEAEDCSTLQPLTLVPFARFRRELDEMAQLGMELGFMDVAGLCELPDPDRIEDWFVSLRAGAELLLAAQELIAFDPTNP